MGPPLLLAPTDVLERRRRGALGTAAVAWEMELSLVVFAANKKEHIGLHEELRNQRKFVLEKKTVRDKKKDQETKQYFLDQGNNFLFFNGGT